MLQICDRLSFVFAIGSATVIYCCHIILWTLVRTVAVGCSLIDALFYPDSWKHKGACTSLWVIYFFPCSLCPRCVLVQKGMSVQGWSRGCHSSKIVSLPLSMIVISSPRGSHRVVHWLRVDNWSRRTYVPVLFYLASQPTASIYVCASVGMLEENKRGENVKRGAYCCECFMHRT